ncbi:MAG: hypothetical protein WA172_08110 [Terriglobales bacterium]
MPPGRTKLMLDEQSFQGLLAAAFTIQQHNDRQYNDRQGAGSGANLGANQPRLRPPDLCRHCGVPLPPGRTSCPTCDDENPRSGEHLQHLWASMWLVSQERGLAPQPRKNAPPNASPLPADELAVHHPSFDHAPPNNHGLNLSSRENPGSDDPAEDSALSTSSTALSGSDDPSGSDPSDNDPPGDDPPGDDPGDDPATVATDSTAASSHGLSVLWGRLRSRRADLYLGVAVLVAVVALLWPTTTPQGSSLPTWERALVAMGIAETTQPVAHFRGDPNVRVWVDTHTALYYCPGEELYAKSPDGHYSTQREAQSDRFEPAERSVCVQ